MLDCKGIQKRISKNFRVEINTQRTENKSSFRLGVFLNVLGYIIPLRPFSFLFLLLSAAFLFYLVLSASVKAMPFSLPKSSPEYVEVPNNARNNCFRFQLLHQPFPVATLAVWPLSLYSSTSHYIWMILSQSPPVDCMSKISYTISRIISNDTDVTLRTGFRHVTNARWCKVRQKVFSVQFLSDQQASILFTN